DAAETLLVSRRFLAATSDESRLKFAHENLYHFLRRWTRHQGNAVYGGNLILDRPAMMARLDPLAKGEVYYMSGNFSESFESFSPIWLRVQEVTNFSSEEIEKSYYPYLSAVFQSSIEMNCPIQAVAKIALIRGYMGVHNFPLLQGELKV